MSEQERTVIEVLVNELDTERFPGEAIYDTYTSEGVAIVLCNALGLDVSLPVSVLARRLAAGQRAERAPLTVQVRYGPGSAGSDRRSDYGDGWSACLAWIRGEDQ